MNGTYNKNVFHRFTVSSLKANRVRTTVTIIGIVLSMALLTAVIEGAFSGMEYLKNIEIYQSGRWEGMLDQISREEAESFENDSKIQDAAWVRQLGWADIDSKNEYKPYLLIREMSENYPELVSLNLTEGRLPENEHEILIPDHLKSSGGVTYHIGDVIELEVGRRAAKSASEDTAAGEELSIYDPFDSMVAEEITDTERITYTVTGTYPRSDVAIEPYSSPGFTSLTCPKADAADTLASSEYTCFFTMKDPAEFYDYIEQRGIADTVTVHTTILNFYGVNENGGVNNMLYGLAAILIVLIIFGSVTLIFNSFSISVSERTKQFGILKSVGATRKQLRQAVLFEALILSAAGILAGVIVGCLGIGITLRALSGSFSRIIPEAGSVRLKLIISPLMLVIAAVLCLITVIISAQIPAGRAMRVSAIDSIRQTGDIKITGKKVRTSLLTQKLFGFEGMPYYILTIALSYALSGYYSLYRGQHFAYSKTRTKYINWKPDE